MILKHDLLDACRMKPRPKPISRQMYTAAMGQLHGGRGTTAVQGVLDHGDGSVENSAITTVLMRSITMLIALRALVGSRSTSTFTRSMLPLRMV